MAKKKILYVVEAMGGGVFTYIVDLANQLVKSYDMYVAYGVRLQTPADYKDYFDKSIHLIKVNSFERSINPFKDFKAVLEIKEIAKKVNPDIIHLHSSKAGVIGRLAFNGHSVPVFYTPHGYSFLMNNYNIVKRTIFKIIESIMAMRRCTTISCSFGEHQETLKMTKRATFVNNGIDIDDLESILCNVPRSDHDLTVFTLGRICHQKNPVLFNQIAQSMPSVKFLWIGDGDLRYELQSKNIEVTGWVDRKEALKRCANADVFLLTSLWEGLPISLLESMYMRKLCVVSDVIGNHDVIHNGVNGFVCDTIDEYKAAICSTENNKLLDNAFNDILTQYNTALMSERYAKIYEEHS